MSFADKALLVTVKVGTFDSSITDRDETRAICKEHGASAKAVALRKRILPKDALAEIGSYDSQFYKFHRARTLPWNDDGTRMLPTRGFDEYMTRWRGYKNGRPALVDRICDHFDTNKHAAKIALGTLFKEGDYPTSTALRGKFYVAMDLLPVPSSRDFRVEVAEGEKREMEANLEARMGEVELRVKADLFARLADPLTRMASKLGEEEVSLRTTNPLVRDLREIIDLIPRLNIAGDPGLEAIRERMDRELGGLTPDLLKDNEIVRANAMRKAQGILDAMADFMGPPPAVLADAA